MPTQQQIAADLGVSQQTVSATLGKLGFLKREWEAMPLEEVRRLLVKHYSETAAGRGGDDQYNLTQERARESRLKGDLLQFQIQEKAAALIPADAVEQEWQALVAAAQVEFLTIPGKLAATLKALYGIDVDLALVKQPFSDALNRLSKKA